MFYEDFQCPVCEARESEVGGYVDQQVKQHALSVEYGPIAILDRESTTESLTRSFNAAACVINDAGAGVFHVARLAAEVWDPDRHVVQVHRGDRDVAEHAGCREATAIYT